MSRAENRHYTKKWKDKRKKHLADKCGNAQCTICHSSKVIGIPKRQEMRQLPINKIIEESYNGSIEI